MANPGASIGLTAAEVAQRMAQGEVNRAPRSEWAEYLDILRRNTLTLFNALVVPAAIILFLLGEWQDGCAVSGMAVTNALLGLIQEVRAKKHLDKLSLLAETTVRVVRDGKVCAIPSGEVVRGDLIEIMTGEPVVADGSVQEARYLEIDESLLTGESEPVQRRAGDRVLSGSFCVAGDGSYTAEQVGGASFAQRTAAEARVYRYTASPLQHIIDRLIRILTGTAIVLCAGYVVLYSARDLPERDLVRMVAATITSMVPQGLVLMATLAFVLGAVRLAKQGAIVRRLGAVETMAAVDTLCLDKTGTLTTNRLCLERVLVVTSAVSADVVWHRLRLFASASADHGNRTLAALRLAMGQSAGELVDFLPFKAQNRYSAVRARGGEAEYILALGAPEALRQFLDSSVDCTWEEAAQQLLALGMRVLLFAEGGGKQARFDGSLEGFALRPLAVVGLGDELRHDVGKVLQELAGQGIRLKIISGDHPRTVQTTVASLAGNAGVLHSLIETPVVTAQEIEAAKDRAALICGRTIFGRVSPWQKVEIITTLKAQGHHVAMVGDGVNDVLPLKQAHLGVAMGEGSTASTAVADLVLQSNDFQLLPQTLQEGRTIVRNIRRAAKLFLTKNVYTLMLIIGFGLTFPRLAFPFLPRQVTLLNLLTIGLPAVLILLGRQASQSAPRVGFLREVGSFVLRSGVVIGAAGLWLLWQTEASGSNDKVLERTVLLSSLILLGLLTIPRALRDGEAGFVRGDGRLLVAALAAAAAYLVVMYSAPLAWFFDLRPLSPEQWGRILVPCLASLCVLLLSDLWVHRRQFRATSAATRPGG